MMIISGRMKLKVIQNTFIMIYCIYFAGKFQKSIDLEQISTSFLSLLFKCCTKIKTFCISLPHSPIGPLRAT